MGMIARIARLIPVIAGGSVLLISGAHAQEQRGRVYELYNSTTTPQNYKRILKRVIDRAERVKTRNDGAPRTDKADPAFKLGRVYALPNPVMGAVSPIIHVEAGLADKLEIQLFAPEGYLLEEASVIDQPKVLKGVYAFEYKLASSRTSYSNCVFKVKVFKSGFTPLEYSGNIVFLGAGQKKW